MKGAVILFVVFWYTVKIFGGTYSGGNGSSENPYQISSPLNLAEFCATTSDWARGVYLYKLQTDNFNAVRKLIFIK
ncbi:MAG: hypothetical protein A2499_18860 [Stygiobacter sp. RIFOXYC12_FULL_38_8]|nr:MAG: hypothetical protein A2X62_08605 [Stygiobacter sp. GWC2_38_9]OGU81483.1 MAG: hypothetical protein A2279_00540 [Stygiobacter sp. RIFOXYA12_FULL_38_9]OGV09713.1 MAG: hypothetical protein A2299_14300 [Stygiobacter sp. RIFOXYB2_FULL_37_11]OGV10147.1 MAG: hypothetical protein A2237_16780 [Stygiobacter sp. RIFOXYA2_FULL_38_8]OGV13580.1 MAG: hypothetical protein A2440_10435 [Stygiobacter sp. RIFOXYC2_FULL_38_25]OGV26691.1 MAG: hypothetical protein A2499_18860 [Stygiobacter sp. RIFOXYC12_FULL_